MRKKSWLSIILLFCLCLGSGCSSSDALRAVEIGMNIDGQERVVSGYHWKEQDYVGVTELERILKHTKHEFAGFVADETWKIFSLSKANTQDLPSNLGSTDKIEEDFQTYLAGLGSETPEFKTLTLDFYHDEDAEPRPVEGIRIAGKDFVPPSVFFDIIGLEHGKSGEELILKTSYGEEKTAKEPKQARHKPKEPKEPKTPPSPSAKDPVMSLHIDNDRNYDWYIDQMDTGTANYNNCGPSCAVMAQHWYKGARSEDTAEKARTMYPLDNGWWYTDTIKDYFKAKGIPHHEEAYRSPADIQKVIDEGLIAILCIDTSYLPYSPTSDKIGKFYDVNDGHFIIVKGYAMIDDQLYFEVYDPNSWGMKDENGEYLGKNRLYSSKELNDAIMNWWQHIIVVGS